MKSWGGQHAKQRVALCLSAKGRVCHLCGIDGATSADHDPPRSLLLRLGVPDPDALEYLWPAHLLCNVRRKARPITDTLRDSLRDRHLLDTDAAVRSPRFERRRSSPPTPTTTVGIRRVSPRGAQEKSEEPRP